MEDWIAVIGPGAIGGLLAASLRRSGAPVVLVGRNSARLAALKREGLHVTWLDGKTSRERGWMEATSRPKPRPGCAAALLCVKTGDLPSALRVARKIAGPATAIISLLNGVTHVNRTRKIFGPRRTVFGSCYVASTRARSNAVIHQGGRVIMLAREAGNARSLVAARSLLTAAGWDVRTAPSLDRLLWTKMILNAALNPLSALTHKTNGEVGEDPALRELLFRAIEEAEKIARAAGHAPLYANMKSKALAACRAAPAQVNSMTQDLAAGRGTEADAILRPFLRAARSAQIPAVMLSLLYGMVKRLEKNLDAR